MAIVASNQISIVDVTDGAEGKGVSSVTPEYYLSASKTTQTGGSWSTTPPTWSSGKYLWVRYIVTYTDSSVSRTDPYCDTSWEAVKEIEIGSRNLLLNTKTFTEASPTSLSGSFLSGISLSEDKYRDLAVRGATVTASVTEVCRYNFTDFNLGDTFTFSFYAKGDVPELRVFFYGATGYVQVANCVNSQGKTSTNIDGRLSFNITSDWQRYWVTWTLKTTGDISIPKYVMLRTNDATSGQTVYVCGCKLESGNKATDWSPAPEDVDNNITNAVDAVEIGSRNIATGTANMVIGSGKWEKGHWRKSGTGTIETIDIVDSPISGVNKCAKLIASTAGKQIGICQDLIPLNNSDIYTLSCWVRGSSSGLTCKLQPFYASSTDTGGIETFTLTGEWQYISYTTVRSPLNTVTYSGCYVYLYPSANGDTMEVCGLKLERGNKATDWSPAPEDVDAKTNEAAKTATNFMNFNNSVLVIGDMTANTLGNNVLIDSDSVDIRNGDTIMASYGAYTTIGSTTGRHILIDDDSIDIKNGNTVLSKFTGDTIYIGKNTFNPTIDLCNGSGIITGSNQNGCLCLFIKSNRVALLGNKYGEYGSNTSIDCSGSDGNILLSSSTVTISGTLILSKTTDASGTAYNSPALVVGGTSTQHHLEFDANEIMAKSDGTTPSTLTLNRDGGNVYIGNGSGNLFGVCQVVDQGILTPAPGQDTTKNIPYRAGRTKVIIEMWTTGPTGYYNSAYETISSSMTAVSKTLLTKLYDSLGYFSISKSGVITLYNTTKSSSTSTGLIHYRVTHFN